jgi:hypothetical protein
MSVCEKHTQYHILGLLGFLNNHMVDLPVGEVLLPLQTLMLISSLIRLPVRTVHSHMACQSTLETCIKSLASQRGGILLGLGCRTRSLRNILPRLLHH